MTLYASAISWGPVTLPEVIWTLIGVLGLAVTWSNQKDARGYVQDADSAQPNGHSPETIRMMRLIATSHFEQELWRLFKFSVIVSTGTAAMIAPPANHTSPISTLQIIVTVGIFLLGVAMLGAAYSERVYRRRLRADT